MSVAPLAIAGLGMSGMALASAVISKCERQGEEPNLLLLDPRQSYQRDRTWSYWSTHETPFDAAISHRWHTWKVGANGQYVQASSEEIPYVRVDSGDYYRIGLDALTRSKALDLRLGTSVKALVPRERRVDIETDRGTLAAKQVVDTRPQTLPPGILLQHFMGWEIEVAEDHFDPHVVTLMDFMPTRGGDIHFFYVLPLSKRRALVESTHFSHALREKKAYEAENAAYLRNHLGIGQWHTVGEERGVIPMPARPAPAIARDPRIISFGLHGDTSKPSSGYCYLQAHRQEARQAGLMPGMEALEQDAVMQHAPARTPLPKWLDGVFISFLEHHPDQAPTAFLELFKRVEPNALIRFLSDLASPQDYLQVMKALPAGTMLREALRYALTQSS